MSCSAWPGMLPCSNLVFLWDHTKHASGADQVRLRSGFGGPMAQAITDAPVSTMLSLTWFCQIPALPQKRTFANGTQCTACQNFRYPYAILPACDRDDQSSCIGCSRGGRTVHAARIRQLGMKG